MFTEHNQHIAPRNIGLIVDWMTSRIRPISVNPKTIPKNESSIMRAICFESPKDHLVRGAILGTEEPISNVSARVIFGLKQTLGTGCHEIITNNEVIQDYIEGDERKINSFNKRIINTRKIYEYIWRFITEC